jgi:DNA-binding PadR family transcriptional regulator
MGPRPNDFGFSAWAACAGPGFSFGPRFRHRHRHRRVFERGDLKFVILGMLAEKPMHGYEVMQRLEQDSGGFSSASPGSVYPALQMLQDQGYVGSEEQDGKRVYSITEEGRAFLDRNSERVDDVFDRVTDFGERFTGAAMKDLTKSFVRLAQVSFEAATRHAGDGETINAVKDILDRAARDMGDVRSKSRRPTGEGG